MPIFRYQCQECNSEFELLLPRYDSPAECPKCGSVKLEKALNRVGVISSAPAGASCAMRNECPSGGCCCPGSCGHKH